MVCQQKNDFTRNSGPVWVYNDGGTKVDTGRAESPPVHNRSIIQNPLSLLLLGELGAARTHPGFLQFDVFWVWESRTWVCSPNSVSDTGFPNVVL
jgi:hypothetical protein